MLNQSINIAGVGKVRPAGQIRLASSVNPARSGPSVVTLWPARVVTCGVDHGLAFHTHAISDCESVRNWHCNLIRYASYGYKQPADTAPTAAWLMRQHQVASGSPDIQLHVKFLASSPLAFFSNHMSECDFRLLVCHSKKIAAMFRSSYCCKQLFSKMKNY